MTGFGGWDMPLYYTGDGMGIKNEHLHCRAQAGLFDVSHMLGVKITGADRAAFMEKVLPADVSNLPSGVGTLTSIPNEQGGLIDDCIITNAGDHLFLVINAGHDLIDLPHINNVMSSFSGDVELKTLDGNGILALQGPESAAVLSKLCDIDLSTFSFMTGRTATIAGIQDCFITRSGYTGEDGFEITVSPDATVELGQKLLADAAVKPVGLGARDSLRLEAGLCLYGNDLDTTTTPNEAGLLWTIPKSRRETGGFVGSDVILGQIKNKKLVTRKRVGFVLGGKGPPPRSDMEVYNMDDELVGTITSGVHGPTFGAPCAMGYVTKKYAKAGTELQVKIRKKKYPLVVSKMPFVPANFFRG